MRRPRRDTPGFTLIELLIVMIVLAVLAGIVIPRFLSTKDRAFVATLRSDLRNLTAAQGAYFDDNRMYAGNLGDLQRFFTPSDNVTVEIDSATTSGWGATATHPSVGLVCAVAVSDEGARAPECAEP